VDTVKAIIGILEAYRHPDGAWYATTAVGVLPLVTVLFEIDAAGGRWNALGMTRVSINGVTTVMLSVYALIPSDSTAAQYIKGGVDTKNKTPEQQVEG
jgi:hypothetical protein